MNPSGEQFEIAHGDQQAIVVEVGGGLRRYRHGGFDVLDGYGEAEMCTGGRGQPLIPWPNRIAGGCYRFADAEHQLALTEPEAGNAIHGLLRWRRWQAVERRPDRVAMETLLHPQPGYPFTLRARITYSLDAGGLRVAVEARNEGRAALPYGAGQHPYLRAGEGLIDSMTVQSPAETRLVGGDHGIPTGERLPVAGEYDLRRPQTLGERRLDTAFTDLARDPDGLARVRLSSSEREVAVWLGPGFEHLMLFTGDTLAPDARRRGLAVEPMTCPPNAFRSGEAVRVLEPGAAWAVEWGIAVSTH